MIKNFLQDIENPARKTFRKGTHRVISPEETFYSFSRFMAAMGITRIANVTGLDSIGIPVVMVCRPNSRSLSVSQGKGLDLPLAKVSGLMETVEQYHAERIHLPLKFGSYEGLRYTNPLVFPYIASMFRVSSHMECYAELHRQNY